MFTKLLDIIKDVFDMIFPSEIEKLESFDNNPDFGYRYQGYTKLVDISILSQVEYVTNVSNCFSFCRSLQDISPIANWDVSKCKSFFSMFLNCHSLNDISPLSNWKVNAKQVGVSNFKWMLKGTNVTDISPILPWFDDMDVDEVKYILFG